MQQGGQPAAQGQAQGGNGAQAGSNGQAQAGNGGSPQGSNNSSPTPMQTGTTSTPMVISGQANMAAATPAGTPGSDTGDFPLCCIFPAFLTIFLCCSGPTS